MPTTEIHDPLTETKDSHETTGRLVQIKASGMMCSFCTMSVEKALGRIDGVNNVQVNLVHGIILIDRDAGLVSISRLEKAVESLGYSVVSTETQQYETDEAIFATIKHRGFLALGLALLDILIDPLKILGSFGVSFPPLVYPIFSGILALVVLTWIGYPILRKTIMAIRNRVINANVLLSTAAWGAFAIGVVHLLSVAGGEATASQWPSFFPIAALLMGLHLFFGYFKLATRKNAAEAVRRLLSLQAQRARVLRGGVEVPADEVSAGETVILRPGDRVPVDGEVIEGTSSLDVATVTGESAPAHAEPGKEVVAGTTNLDGFLKVKATRVGEETFLNQVVRLMHQIEERKPPVMLLMDRLMNYYGPVVFIASGVAGLGWFVGLVANGVVPSAALPKAIYVALTTIIMGYPCALGITTPMVLAIGGSKGLGRGLLVKAGEFFQELSQVDTVVFDKTGTLTYGRPTVKEIRAWDIDEHELLSLIHAAEQPSEHPLAKAIVKYVEMQGFQDLPVADEFRAIPGQGVSSHVAGRTVLIGKKGFLLDRGIDLDLARQAADLEMDNTVVYVAVDGSLAGAVALQDLPRPGAQYVMSRLDNLGLKTAMLTGDSRTVAESIARQTGIEKVYAELLPAQKVERIQQLQQDGHKVAMVGDGVNDAPALVQSDVGIALGAGTDVAMESAGVVLVSDRIDRALGAILLGRASHRKMKQNIAFAVLFNGLGIGLAVAGLLTPAMAITVMTLSVFAVLLNTALLMRVDLGEASEKPENSSFVEAEISAPHMVCQGCATKVIQALSAVPGVHQVLPDVARKSVQVLDDPSKVNEAELRERVAEIGYL